MKTITTIIKIPYEVEVCAGLEYKDACALLKKCDEAFPSRSAVFTIQCKPYQEKWSLMVRFTAVAEEFLADPDKFYIDFEV